MALRPPRHRIDAEPKLISRYDPSWLERLDIELAEDEEKAQQHAIAAVERAQRVAKGEDPPPMEGPEQHPHHVYTSGQTRFDLAAPIRYRGVDVQITDYLDGDQTAFCLGQLPGAQWYRISGMLSTSAMLNEQDDVAEAHRVANEAFLEAFKWGLKGIENGPDLKFARDGSVSAETMNEILLSSEQGAGLVHEIGAAVVAYNRKLSTAEKKV